MIASARIAYLANRANDYGVNVSDVSVNLKKVVQRKNEMVESFRQGSQRRLEQVENMDLIFGTARFINSKAVEILGNNGGSRRLKAKIIIINVGSKPYIPDIPGLSEVSYLDSTGIMKLNVIPEHLIIIGGGYIGLEFGQMFRRFGSKVTIIHRGKQLLNREDPDIAEEVFKIFKEDGINVLLNSTIERVLKSSSDNIKVVCKSGDSEIIVKGSHILLATGRSPNTAELNLDAAGIKVDQQGYIKVNEKLETTAPRVYAIGDVKGGPAFTHISYDDFRILRTNLLEGGIATITGRQVPYTVFIDPQLARIGITEEEAKEKGITYRVAKMPMSYVARAIETNETRGIMKVIVNDKSKQILGCAILAAEGGEIMAMLQIAMMGKMPYSLLKDGIFAHPTFAESLNNLFMNLDK
jgi:pyruvate/2-oxoglutarate dehydrogenase complex dihydrolipoamide dehydrogenase (E3) component